MQQQPAGQHVQLDMIDMSSPRASVAAGAGGVHFDVAAETACAQHSHQQHHHKQQQQQDLDGSSWDPFGLCDSSHHQQQQQQQQQLRPQHQQPQAGSPGPWHGDLVQAADEAVVQELQGLSFTGLSSPQHGLVDEAPRQQQQQQQLAEDDWGDFLSPHPAH
jgi:hypothetical protein